MAICISRPVPVALCVLLGALLTACGGSSKKYLVPVDAPGLKPFMAPEADDLSGDDADDWDSEDGVDETDDTIPESEAPEPTPTAKAQAPAAKPVAKAPTASPPVAGDRSPSSIKGKPAKTPGAAIAGGNMRVSTGLSRDAIRSVIRARRAQLRNCYERELLRDPALAGRVSVTFSIELDGSVTNVASSGMAVVDACVGKTFGAMKFPKPTGQRVRVTYPIVFSSSSK